MTEALHRLIQRMPKVEIHVHLEGSIRPATLLKLARRHGVALPAEDEAGLRRWYRFRDFAHFVEIYMTISDCLRDPEDIELIAREFLQGQADQGVVYSEVTYTAFTHYQEKGMSIDSQLAAIDRARAWAEASLGVRMALVLDIPRYIVPGQALLVADWVIAARDRGVIALGLGGPEEGHPPESFAAAFDKVHAAGMACVPHAGETVGPASIWGALKELHACRLGHGVRCLEDPELTAYLRERQIPLEVCPTSNLCLNVAPNMAAHPLPRLLEQGLYVTINSDDPPMFNTTLTDEYHAIACAFDFDADRIQTLVLNGARATLLAEPEKQRLAADFTNRFTQLRSEEGL